MIPPVRLEKCDPPSRWPPHHEATFSGVRTRTSNRFRLIPPASLFRAPQQTGNALGQVFRPPQRDSPLIIRRPTKKRRSLGVSAHSCERRTPPRAPSTRRVFVRGRGCRVAIIWRDQKRRERFYETREESCRRRDQKKKKEARRRRGRRRPVGLRTELGRRKEGGGAGGSEESLLTGEKRKECDFHRGGAGGVPGIRSPAGLMFRRLPTKHTHLLGEERRRTAAP